MKIFSIMIAAVLLAATPSSAREGLLPPPTSSTITIFTGAVNGTYFRIGEDIRQACPSLDIRIVPTQGSIENLNHLVNNSTGNSFALVQRDVMQRIIGSRDKEQAVIQVLSPLYAEVITVVVNKGSGITGISGLAGKRVAIGTPGSGVWFSSNSIKTLLGLEWISIERSYEESILSLLTGDIDAMIMVTGHPFRAYEALPKIVDTRIEFINVAHPLLERFYSPAKLEAGTYMWQKNEVRTVATKSILIAAKGVPEDKKTALLTCITTTHDELKKWGHPRWKEIHLDTQKIN